MFGRKRFVKANSAGADLRGALIEEVDFTLVVCAALGTISTPSRALHSRCGASLAGAVTGGRLFPGRRDRGRL